MKAFLKLAAVLSFAITVPVHAQESAHMKLKTVVIDAGHGGKDAGCVSRDKKTYEKNITLDIAKRLSQKISAEYSDVTVKMTRSSDKFVELENRAVIANKADANLFISIHVNAVAKGTQANGFSIHCLGQSAKKGNDLYSKNLDLVKRENSVILLEDNYQTRYQGFDPSDPQSYIIFSLMQNAHLSQSLSFAEDVAAELSKGPIKNNRGVSQDPFWVLWRTAMPAVLIEVGFMTNPEDLSTMRTEKGREGIAEGIFRAFKAFKTRYDGNPGSNEAQLQEESQDMVMGRRTIVEEDSASAYGIQVLAVSRAVKENDPFFQGYKPAVYQAGNLKKYIICKSSSLNDVKKKYPEVKKKFPDSYVVRIDGNTVSPIR